MSLRKALVLNIPWDFLRGDVFKRNWGSEMVDMAGVAQETQVAFVNYSAFVCRFILRKPLSKGD